MQYDEPLFYSVEQAARRLGIGKTLLYEPIDMQQHMVYHQWEP